MNTIINTKKCECIIKNSKFISLCFQVNNPKEVQLYLEQTKKEYPNASHYCYAYIINGYIKCSDDKEPSNTAGIVILNILKHLNLNYTLVIIVRYFGGTKLGVGGLIRAYSTSAKQCLEENIKEIKEYILAQIKFNYDEENKIRNIINNCIIKSKSYNNQIIYEILCENKELNLLKENNIQVTIIQDKYIN